MVNVCIECLLDHTGERANMFCGCRCHTEEPVAAHRQEVFTCAVCGRSLIVDLFSIGTEHQTIRAVTCYECAKSAGGNIMQGNVDLFNIGP